MPTKSGDTSPFKLATGSNEDFTSFRTFGCRVWVRPPGARKGRLQNHARKGIFLGYLPNTTKNILWFDVESKRVKIAFHARFDEGMNDLPLADIPPNVQHLKRVLDGVPLPIDPTELTPDSIHFTAQPFLTARDDKIRLTCQDDTFGFRLATDTATNRVYICDIISNSSASTLRRTSRSTRHQCLGAFLLAINDTPVFTITDAKKAFTTFRRDFPSATSLGLTLAPEPLPNKRDRDTALKELDIYSNITPEEHIDSLSFSVDEIRAIHALRSSTSIEDSRDVSTEELDFLFNSLQSETMTDAERAMGSLSLVHISEPTRQY